MSFTFTAEQDELRGSLRRFFAEYSPSAEVRRLVDGPTGYDPVVWQRMADQLGLQGIAIPAEYGGAGYGAVELGIVFEEMGRVLLPGPFFASIGLAAQLLLALGDEGANREWLPGLADGSLLATVAVAEEAGDWDIATVATSAVSAGDAWSLRGSKMFVVDGMLANLLLVLARVGDELGVFAVRGDAAGVKREPLAALDFTRRLARVELSDAPARRLGDGDATVAVRRALDRAVAALASEQAGGADRCLEMAVDYARLREQFGRPIGSFQAIKHKCAEMLLSVESAKSAAYFAAWSLAESSDEVPVAVSMAKACCSEAFVDVAADTIQIHGGVGFTWEHDAHLYLRRAKSSQLLFGDPDFYRDRLAVLVGIAAPAVVAS